MIKLVFFSLLVVGGVGLAGLFITRRLVPEWSTGALLFGAGVNLGGCWVSFIPVAIADRQNKDYLPQAALAGIVVRLIVVGAAALIALNAGPWDIWPVSVWLIVFYLSLLAVETAVTVRLLGSIPEGKDGTISR